MEKPSKMSKNLEKTVKNIKNRQDYRKTAKKPSKISNNFEKTAKNVEKP